MAAQARWIEPSPTETATATAHAERTVQRVNDQFALYVMRLHVSRATRAERARSVEDAQVEAFRAITAHAGLLYGDRVELYTLLVSSSDMLDRLWSAGSLEFSTSHGPASAI